MSISKKILTFMFAGVLLAAVGAGVYWDSYFFVVKKINLQSEANALHAEIRASVEKSISKKTQELQNKNIWQIDLVDLEKKILANNWVESVTIDRALPDNLNINLQFKKVAFLYRDFKGHTIPVSVDGELLDPISFTQAPDVPFIKNPSMIKNKDILKKVIALFHTLPANGFLSQHDVATVDWAEPTGLRVELTQHTDGTIILGDSEVSVKAKRVITVLKYLESQKQKWRVIDASLSKKVLVRLRKQS